MATLVLLPGMDGTGDLFAPFVQAYRGPTRVVRYPPTQALDYGELTEVARSQIPPANEPCVLLGESFSGPIAISLAARRPPNIVGLILCCSFARNPRPLLAPLRFIAGVLPARPPSQPLEALLCGRHASPQMRVLLTQALAQVSGEALRARLRAVAQVDVVKRLQSVEVPILYLRAGEDRLVPRKASELVAAHARQSRIVEIAGPHFLLQAMPAAAASVIREFVEETPD